MHLTTSTRAPLFLSMFVVLAGSAACEAGQMPSLDEAGDGSSSGGSSRDGSDDSSGLDDSETWEPESPPDHVTEHLEIWDFGPEELCVGQIARMEREVVRLSDEMGLSVHGLRVAWGASATEELADVEQRLRVACDERRVGSFGTRGAPPDREGQSVTQADAALADAASARACGRPQTPASTLVGMAADREAS
ncbi:MAG: hypothetical protein JKY37_08680 [Nannocystaceae bacterium]|nr:hypothetical protein [Nannocystaceae bacterium]